MNKNYRSFNFLLKNIYLRKRKAFSFEEEKESLSWWQNFSGELAKYQKIVDDAEVSDVANGGLAVGGVVIIGAVVVVMFGSVAIVIGGT